MFPIVKLGCWSDQRMSAVYITPAALLKHTTVVRAAHGRGMCPKYACLHFSWEVLRVLTPEGCLTMWKQSACGSCSFKNSCIRCVPMGQMPSTVQQ